MPKTNIIFFTNQKGLSPLKNWLAELPNKVLDKFTVRIERLEELGHELRRPEADFLRDGIYELRVRHQNINYRILYFFHGQTSVLYDGLTKEDAVPSVNIDRGIAAKVLFARHPNQHTYHEDRDNENQGKTNH